MISRRRLAAVALGAALAGPHGLPRAAEPERPALVDEIERRFGHSFLVTTDGGGTYTLHQRVENARGLTAADEVVCVMRECWLVLAQAPAAAIDATAAAPARLAAVRDRLRAVRDAYEALRRAGAPDVAARAQAWRAAIAAVGPCLANGEC